VPPLRLEAAVLSDHRLDLDDTEIVPIVRVLIGDSVDRRGNLTCLAVTLESRTITLGCTAN
jgi:hypothetical protein